MPKQTRYSEEARQAMKRGVDKLSNAVKTTLGARGRNVVIQRGDGLPLVTKDGVTVAKETVLKDYMENMGAQLVKEAASKTNDVAGDGTTTATVLAQALIHEGLKHVTAGVNPLALKRGIDKGVEVLVNELQFSISQKVESGDVEKVATISANDALIGKTIADAVNQMGDKGIITVEDGGMDMEVKVVKGMRLNRGYTSPYMVTDQEKMEVHMTNPLILITDKKVTMNKEIVPILEKVIPRGIKDIVFVTDGLEGEALGTIIVNKMRGAFNVLSIRLPGFGDEKKALTQDLAILTGATILGDETGRMIENAELTDLGSCARLEGDKDYTTFIDGKGDSNAIDARIKAIEKLISETDNVYEKDRLSERLAKFTGGIGIIRVGGATEAEMKEKRYRVEDAVAATRAALEEGIVPGGGVALIRAAKSLESLQLEQDEQLGIKVLSNAVLEPLKAIVENAGLSGDVILNQILSLDKNMGFNVVTGQCEDMLQSGIVDPTKVTRCALQNAASVAGTFLTTECVLEDEKPEEKK